MLILGIETSCDETAASLVENGTKILANVVTSSAQIHAKAGGIIPEQAARQQLIWIIPVISEALKRGCGWSPQKNSPPPIDAIAVTIGPGLIGSLLVGIETAKTLAVVWKKPIVPVNHLVAHIYANWLKVEGKNNRHPLFPALALVVSGGHTDLILMKGHGKLLWIGGTRDDAAGEAFDKCARLLGLAYPGGPSISKEAEKFFKNPESKKQKLNLFPRPLLKEKNFDFSFSGLKTAVLREVKGESLSKKTIQRLAAEIQEAIVDSLIAKSIKAIKKYRPKSFLLAGGVAANKRLRNKFIFQIKNEILQVFHVPTSDLCTDNAAYIASFAFFNFKPKTLKKIIAKPDLTIVGEA